MEHGLQVEWTTKAVKDMRRFPAPDRERIIAKVEQYAEDPNSLGGQVISLTNSEYRRMRVGDYRVIFKTERGKAAVMAVLRVRHRKDAYD